MIKRSYRLDGEEEILMSETILDPNDRKLSVKEYHPDYTEEVQYEYNEKDLVTREVHLEDGQEQNVVESTYDDAGQLLEQQTLIGGELYEKIQTRFHEAGFERSKWIEEEEV